SRLRTDFPKIYGSSPNGRMLTTRRRFFQNILTLGAWHEPRGAGEWRGHRTDGFHVHLDQRRPVLVQGLVEHGPHFDRGAHLAAPDAERLGDSNEVWCRQIHAEATTVEVTVLQVAQDAVT